MTSYRFDYSIWPDPNERLFYAWRSTLEMYVSGLVRECSLLEDVDGSLIQCYQHPLGKLRLENSEFVGALYIESEFELMPYLKSRIATPGHLDAKNGVLNYRMKCWHKAFR